MESSTYSCSSGATNGCKNTQACGRTDEVPKDSQEEDNASTTVEVQSDITCLMDLDTTNELNLEERATGRPINILEGVGMAFQMDYPTVVGDLETALNLMTPLEPAIIIINCRLEPISDPEALLRTVDNSLLYPSPAHLLEVEDHHASEPMECHPAWEEEQAHHQQDIEMNVPEEQPRQHFTPVLPVLCRAIVPAVILVTSGWITFHAYAPIYKLIARCGFYVLLEAFSLIFLLAFVLLAVGRP